MKRENASGGVSAVSPYALRGSDIEISEKMKRVLETEDSIIQHTQSRNEVKAESLSLSDQAQAMTVQSRADYVRGAHLLQLLKGMRKRVADEFGEMVSQAHKAHRAAVAVRKKIDTPLADGEQHLKTLLAGFMSEAKHLGEADHTSRLETATALAEVARKSRADDLRASGDVRGADAVMAGPLIVPPVVRREVVPDINGISYRTRWAATVTDMGALVGACVANPEWLRLLKVNQTELDKLAKALRNNLDVPGVSVTERKEVAVTATEGDEWQV